MLHLISFFFFFNDTATTEIYPLPLHDALPISCFAAAAASSPYPSFFSEFLWTTMCNSVEHSASGTFHCLAAARTSISLAVAPECSGSGMLHGIDRKSTRLNSSHGYISYAVFCL